MIYSKNKVGGLECLLSCLILFRQLLIIDDNQVKMSKGLIYEISEKTMEQVIKKLVKV